MSSLGLNFTTVKLPTTPTFPYLTWKLVDTCVASKALIKKQSQKASKSRFLHCHTLIEGLYQIWCCLRPEAGLNVFLSPLESQTELHRVSLKQSLKPAAPTNKKAPQQQGSMLPKLGSSNDLQRLQDRQLLNRKLMGLGGQFCQLLCWGVQRLAVFDNLLAL